MQWSTRPAETVALAVAGVVLAVLAVLLDPVGRVLVGAAAVLLLLLALRDRVLRPRLATDPDGLLVRRLTGTLELPWALLRVRVRETRRWGVRSRLLELDTAVGADDDGVLVLLGRRDLGTDPEDVARALLELPPAGAEAGGR
ncbi:PH domain-containing protein [Geodermatophilus sp. SYSU D01186]